MSQTASPVADTAAGNYTPSDGSSPLHDLVDEATADDSDYISSPSAPSNEVVVLKFSGLADPLVSDGHNFEYRIRKNASGGSQIDATVELLEGYDGAGGETVIASYSHTDVGNAWTTHSQTLSTAEADSITEYTDLYIRITFTQV